MALLRDVPFDQFDSDPDIAAAAAEIHTRFQQASGDTGDAGRLQTGIDVPGPNGQLTPITKQNAFRLGLPGEEVGPFVSQFFVRDAHYGTQRIDAMELAAAATAMASLTRRPTKTAQTISKPSADISLLRATWRAS